MFWMYLRVSLLIKIVKTNIIKNEFQIKKIYQKISNGILIYASFDFQNINKQQVIAQQVNTVICPVCTGSGVQHVLTLWVKWGWGLSYNRQELLIICERLGSHPFVGGVVLLVILVVCVVIWIMIGLINTPTCYNDWTY